MWLHWMECLIQKMFVKYNLLFLKKEKNQSLFKGHLLGEEEKPTHLELLSCTVQSGGQVWLRYKVSNQQDHEK